MQTTRRDNALAKDDIIAAGDFGAALGLLTRLPIRVDGTWAAARGARAAWAWPLVGLTLALMAGLAGTIANALGLPPTLTAALILALTITLTGAMHEDGLADSFDGLWGGWDRARRLAIMKDSHIGTYGVIGLCLTLLIRWQALVWLLREDLLWAGLIGTAMLSRAAMVGVMWALPAARATGLGHGVGRPQGQTTALALSIATLTVFLLPGLPAFAMLLVGTGVTLGWAAIARAKIGGQTGDILGATQQLTEVALLLTLTASLG